MSTIRILIVDDNNLVRSCIIQLFQDLPDIEVVGEASDGRAAVEMVRQLRPDAVIMDIAMPDMNGIEATTIIRSEFQHIRVIGLSMFNRGDMAELMLKAGATGLFCKCDSWDYIVDGIKEILLSTEPPAPGTL